MADSKLWARPTCLATRNPAHWGQVDKWGLAGCTHAPANRGADCLSITVTAACPNWTGPNNNWQNRGASCRGVHIETYA